MHIFQSDAAGRLSGKDRLCLSRCKSLSVVTDFDPDLFLSPLILHTPGDDLHISDSIRSISVADRIFHDRLKNERRDLTGKSRLHLNVYPEFFLKPCLLDLQIRPDMADLRIKIQHVLIIFQCLAVVRRQRQDQITRFCRIFITDTGDRI